MICELGLYTSLRCTSDPKPLSSFITLLSSLITEQPTAIQFPWYCTTTSIRHLVAPLFHEKSYPTSSEGLLMSKYNYLQNLRVLENHTIARNRAVWEFYVICESDLQLKLVGSSSVTHAFKRHSALTQAGQATVLFAPSEFQDSYNEIGPVHSFLVYSDSTFLILATLQKISSHISYFFF